MLDPRAVIAARCPQVVVESVVPLGDGDFCTVHLVNDEWVFRFAKHNQASASLAREACLPREIAERR